MIANIDIMTIAEEAQFFLELCSKFKYAPLGIRLYDFLAEFYIFEQLVFARLHKSCTWALPSKARNYREKKKDPNTSWFTRYTIDGQELE